MGYKKEIFATYDKKYIRIYQAYNARIAEEAVKEQTFGSNYNMNRMSWIKPSFLWMMYRSNWGTKKNQENILAIDILREGFDSYLNEAVLTTCESNLFSTDKEWEQAFNSTNVYCQWDPDRNAKGKAIDRWAIQIGIKQQALSDFINSYITDIVDLTPKVYKWRKQLNSQKLSLKELPSERMYPVSQAVRTRLNMK